MSESEIEEDFVELAGAVEYGDEVDAVEITRDLLEAAVPPLEVVDRGLVPGMAALGIRFQNGEAFVPEMVMAARAMKDCMELIDPLLVSKGVKPRYTAVIGTVEGDLHDIGKNLVSTMWRGAGFAVVDLGINVPPAKFVDAVQEHEADILGLSALLTTTMTAMETTIQALAEAGLDEVKVIVGGAPITAEYAEAIGANAFCDDASLAAEAALGMLAV